MKINFGVRYMHGDTLTVEGRLFPLR